MALPVEVELCEVGPRDGFQYEARPISIDLKVRIIERLIGAGLPRLQVASFVHPERVPQMADAEEVVSRLGVRGDVVLAGLALNMRGVERAIASGLKHIDLSIATHQAHSLENANMTVDAAVREAERMTKTALDAGMHVQVGLQTVFGYRRPGDTPLHNILSLCELFIAWGAEEISLGDTTGLAHPGLIRDYVGAVSGAMPQIPVVLHLHDTRGLGLANVLAALELGIRRFDASFGGLGGCPFIRGASGNIATEDVAYLLESLGFETGVKTEAVVACTLEMERFLQRQLPSKQARIIELSG